MNDITIVSDANERPLSLIVAEKWHFRSGHVLEEGNYWFAGS